MTPRHAARRARYALDVLIAATSMFVVAQPALALPTAPSVVCEAMPDAAACAGGVPACSLCHESTDPPAWNSFGTALKGKVAGQPDFATALGDALMDLSSWDTDGDGVSDRDELREGTDPAKATVMSGGDASSGDNPRYELDGYDFPFAYRRVMLLYCGRSPTYEENQAFGREASGPAALKERLHAQLSECLESDYWQGNALLRLADKRIRPLKAAGPDSEISIAGYRLVIGDYNDDYRLWRYILTGDRDMRELLTADYHVVEQEDGTLAQVYGLIEKRDSDALAGGQLVDEAHRAGMITTQWFFAINTMFSALPRTTAAQAYRAYLGTDISMGEGLRPVEGEPLDIDDKGVKQDRCALCHSTLDPLSYVFAEYEGIEVSDKLRFGAYLPSRIESKLPGWDPQNQKPTVLGTPISSVVEWGQVASSSPEFQRNMATMFYRHALSRDPVGPDLKEFQGAWAKMPDDGYSANKLIHRIVDTTAFGGP